MKRTNSTETLGRTARIAAAALLSLAALTPLMAQVSRYDEKQVGNTNEKPNILNGVGIAQHLTLWFTAFQQQVPEAARSRVSSYDALGSFILIPLGLAAAGPVAVVIGARPTLIGAGVIALVSNVLIFFIRSIYRVETGVPQAT